VIVADACPHQAYPVGSGRAQSNLCARGAARRRDGEPQLRGRRSPAQGYAGRSDAYVLAECRRERVVSITKLVKQA